VTIAEVVVNPQELALKDAMSNDDKAQQNIVLKKSVHEMAFDLNKKGCADRHSFFLVTLAQYRDGKTIAEVSASPLVTPLVEAIYTDIQTNGVEAATVNSMKRYDDCLKEAKPLADAAANYDMEAKYGVCGRVNEMAMDALSGAQNRKSLESILSKYTNRSSNAPDLSETSYGSMDGVSEMIIGKIYEVSKTRGPEDASMFAAAMSVRCSQ
jgi:hypothetical protein